MIIRQVKHTAGRQAGIGCSAHAHHPQGSHRQCQPETGGPGGISHAGVLPLPAAAFGELEAIFDPGAHPIPGDLGLLRGQIGYHQPRRGVVHFPSNQQSSLDGVNLETGTSTNPGTSRLRQVQAKWQVLAGALGAKLAAQVDTQKGMPALLGNGVKQPVGIQAPIRQHQYQPIAGDGCAQMRQQSQPFILPGAWMGCPQHFPSHRDGTASIDHAEAQDHKSHPQTAGIHRQSQTALFHPPPTQHPLQQRNKASTDDQLLASIPSLSIFLPVPFAQALAYIASFVLRQLSHLLADPAQPTRTSQHDPKAPQPQHARLGFAQVRQMTDNFLFPLGKVICGINRSTPIFGIALSANKFYPYYRSLAFVELPFPSEKPTLVSRGEVDSASDQPGQRAIARLRCPAAPSDAEFLVEDGERGVEQDHRHDALHDRRRGGHADRARVAADRHSHVAADHADRQREYRRL